MIKCLLLLIFSNIIANVLAQSYTPLLNQYNEWKFTTCNFGCLNDTYFTDGDTIVEGQTYKILDGFHYISRTFLLREDVIERKVYMKLSNSTGRPNEFLLYDFSLSVGDFVEVFNPISPFPAEAGIFEVDSIVLKPLIDGNNYRHFYLHPLDIIQSGPNLPIWVEGVGSLSLINAPGGTPNVNGVGKLSCFFKNDELFYSQLDSTTTCTTDYSVSIPTREVSNFMIQSTEKGVYVKHNKDLIFTLSIYNMNGQFLVNKEITGSENVRLDDLAKGVFLMQLRTINGEVKVEKLINN